MEYGYSFISAAIRPRNDIKEMKEISKSYAQQDNT